jgi:hypothetical protein
MDTQNFNEIITPFIEDLWVMSETDAEITPFVWEKDTTFNQENLLTFLEKESDTKVEIITLDKFFAPYTRIHEDDDEDMIATAKRFQELKDKLTSDFKNIQVFRIGEVEIDVCIVFQNNENQYFGLKTFVVET